MRNTFKVFKCGAEEGWGRKKKKNCVRNEQVLQT
jgi:hypothetical protein